MLDTRGVLTKPAAVAVAVVVSLASVLSLGWRMHDAFDAQAAPSPAIEQKLDTLDGRVQAMAIDIAVIKAQLHAMEKNR